MENSKKALELISKVFLSEYSQLYYVNMSTNEYQSYSTDGDLFDVRLEPSGSDFFTMAKHDVDLVVYEDDKAGVLEFLDKQKLPNDTNKETREDFVYRLIIRGKPVYHSLRIFRSTYEGEEYLVLGVLNIDKEYRIKLAADEMEHKLYNANRLARRDELTGIRNKNAYQELEEELDKKLHYGTIDSGVAVVVFDMNDLKIINDHKGHAIGDDYLRKASLMICEVFSHSPVFRIGGDEFVAVLMDKDYIDREYLIAKFKLAVIENGRRGSGPVIACGMSECNFDIDKTIGEVFKRADEAMYEDKDHLKALRQRDGLYNMTEEHLPVPDERKRQLNELFNAVYSIVDGGYVYLLDIKYDYSRWSEELVHDYGLKSEYNYSAGAVWESYIHPDDMPAYRRGLDGVFFDNTGVRQVHYRVCTRDGEYVKCYTRGFIMSDEEGEPDFFGGIIVPEV